MKPSGFRPLSADLTAEYVRSILDYDPESGVFRWRVKRRRASRKGSVAGSINSNGYVLIKVDQRSYAAHRLAWLYVHGEWPPDQIDHINGDRADNRIENLREATRVQNGANARRRDNNTSGVKGVSWHKRRNRWMAQIRCAGNRVYLGYFDTAEEAHAAYMVAAREHFGEFARSA